MCNNYEQHQVYQTTNKAKEVTTEANKKGSKKKKQATS
jgi:hypothetical protein